MTLNVRIVTPQISIQYSDGRKVNNGQSVDEHLTKIISRNDYKLSLAGVLDDALHANSFNILTRLSQNLIYNPVPLHFRENVFELVCNEYDKEIYKTEKQCTILVDHRANNIITNFSLGVINHRCDIIYELRTCLRMQYLILVRIQNINNQLIFNDDFQDAIEALPHDFTFDFHIDHNHIYFVNGTPMETHIRESIGIIFLSSFYEIKGHLPTAFDIQNCSDQEIEDIGNLVYVKHNTIFPHPAIGSFESFSILRI